MDDETKKRCFKCRRTKPIRMFYKHPKMADGYLGKCKACAKKDVAKNYRDNIEAKREYERQRWNDPSRRSMVSKYMDEHRKRYPGKTKARRAVANALKTGAITRLPCEVCGDTKSEAHHEDYRKPLDVRWLCFYHHRIAHGQKPAPKERDR